MSEAPASILDGCLPWSREDFARPADELAPALLGSYLSMDHIFGPVICRITETEAYTQSDPASHSFKGVTKRNRSMFGPPGMLYVYRIYGVHWCLNISCAAEGVGDAVLLRALAPLAGIAQLIPGASAKPEKICSGPGRLCAALGVDGSFDGEDLGQSRIRFWRDPAALPYEMSLGPRIGISQAIEQPWRFGIKSEKSLSRPFPHSQRNESSR